MKRSLIAIVIVLMLAVVAGCQPAAATAYPEAADQYNRQAMPAATYAPAAPMEAPAAGMENASFTSGSGSQSEATRLVIQNVNMSIVVVEPGDAMTAIAKMASDMGGFVVSSNLYKYTTSEGLELPQASITVRVPADKLDAALETIHGLTENPEEDVRSENRSGDDVTDQYTDAQSRLRNLEDTEAQLREIMASATKTEDVMNVFNQLTYVREQIEVIKGQIKYYEESAALSAISVEIVAREAVAPLTIGGWKPEGVARDAVQALINTLKFLANLLIWLVIYALPVALIVGLPIFLIVRAARRRRSKITPPKE